MLLGALNIIARLRSDPRSWMYPQAIGPPAMDKFVAMKVFRSVVDCGSFARASAKLGISTTSASRHVSDLEQAIGVKLLHRSPRQISLTEAGGRYYRRCCQHLDDIAETELTLSNDANVMTGPLRITAPCSFTQAFLGEQLARFIECYPMIQLEVLFSDRLVDLAEDAVDVALRITRSVPDMYVARPLAAIRTTLCASPAYLARCGTPSHPDELAKHNCIGYTNRVIGNCWVLQGGNDKHVVATSGSFRSNSGDMNRTAALAGHGIICEPLFIVGNDLDTGRLVRVLPDFETIPTQLHAIYLPINRSCPRVRALIDFVAEALAAAGPL